MLRVGLTGGIGSGKSTVAKLFVARGVPVIDADEIARKVVTPGLPAYEDVVRAFGEQILDDNRRINREVLRSRIFDNPQERRQLEMILHPRIRAEIQTQADRLRAPYCLVVIPLLVETGQQDLIDRVLLVDAEEDKQIQRVMQRNGLPESEVRKILASQASRADRLQRAQEVIENNADLAHLTAEVERLHRYYLTLSETKN
ncbi:MAG TPA: dephospho-CoA kinase [Acidiferrobacterales bacterium]|nr:dephospho-CoA kinase [Acidiferrobacterales bacterium]